MNHFFTVGESQLDKASAWQKRFEDERVKLVLEEFKLLKHLVPLLTDCERRCGERRLTFADFNARFPSFPILLSVRCRSRVAEICEPAAIFRAYQDIFLFRYYLEAYARGQDMAEGRLVGMVVPFDGYRGSMVVHNGELDTRAATFSFPVPGDVAPYRVTVEPFQGLLKYLARGGWTPNHPLDAKMKVQTAQVPRDFSITPWMVEKLGPGTALVLLGWLRTVLLSSYGFYRHFVRRVAADQRCVAVTQAQLAAETRLSLRQVQRGLKELNKHGLVVSKFRQGRSFIRLSPEALAGLDAKD